MIIFCAIDGVLADITHRLHFKDEGNYDAFYADEALDKDAVIDAGFTFLDSLFTSPVTHYDDVVLVTGRPKKTENATMKWLRRCASNEFLINEYYLLMRKDGDHRKSREVKVELVRGFLDRRCFIGADGQLLASSPILFIDDDPNNVKAVCDAFPTIIGLTFGTGRLEER